MIAGLQECLTSGNVFEDLDLENIDAWMAKARLAARVSIVHHRHLMQVSAAINPASCLRLECVASGPVVARQKLCSRR